jgi:hypothetical protein
MSEAMANGIIKNQAFRPESENTSYSDVRESHRKASQGLTRRQVSATHIARFLAKHAKGGGCWLWTASRYPRGYGMFNLGRDAQGRQHTEYAHRISYVLHHGDIPTGKVVMHSCDNPQCVNPAHLSLGTQGDNIRDAARKGRYSVPHADGTGVLKLTRGDIHAIRMSFARGVDLARAYRVSPACISLVRSHQRRKVA